MTKLKVYQLDAAGAPDGQVPVTAGGKFVLAAGGGSGTTGLPVIDVVADHGAMVDGVTDDTPAWQAALDAAGAAGGARIISSKAGVSIIAGPLQDTSGANAQLVLPKKHVLNDEQISIVIEGPALPPAGGSVIGPTPVPDNGLVLKSTLAAGSGGALLGGVGPAGTYSNFTFVYLRLADVTFRMPTNPANTALNLSCVVGADIENVMVDTGYYDMLSIAEPTTATSYGIRLPKQANGAYTRLSAVNVFGFYNGYQFSEHTVGIQAQALGCKVAFEFVAALHASKFLRLLAQHCQKVVRFTGSHYVDIDQLAIEHATSAWTVTTADIDDPSNYGHGKIKWHACVAGGGVDATFNQNGGTGLAVSRVGAEPSATGLTIQDENGTIATGVTQLDFQGANVQATAGTGEVTVTVTGSSSSGSSGELLMQDGVTGPPVPLETEARDDWLYQG